MEWLTTSILLEQLRDFDNEAAWNRLSECFRPSLLAFARRMGIESSDADDVTQETLIAFANAYRAGKYDREKGRLSDWIFGISYRQIQNSRKKRARREASLVRGAAESVALDELPDRAEATRSWDEEWRRSVLRIALRQVQAEVDARTYRAFEQVVFSKRSAAEVADELGISRNAVFLAKHRIVRRIRELKLSIDGLT